MAHKNRRKKRLIAERVRALAIVRLTSRPDVTIQAEAAEIGVDLLAFITTRGRRGIRQFGVALEGCWEGLTALRAGEVLRPKMREILREGPFPFPVVLFFFTMEDNQEWYTWVAEPFASPDGAVELRVRDEASCQPLDDHAMDEIVDRINGWYDAYYARGSVLTASTV